MKSLQKILIFSDIHLTSGNKKIIGLNPLRKLEFALEHALQNHSDAERIVFSGDLAHNGDIAAYKSLQNLTEPIKIPITFMMGNHDQRIEFSQVFSSIDFDVNGFLQSKVSYRYHDLIFLDTLQYPISRADKNEGFLCSKRLDWLESELSAAQEKKVIIFMHHPAFSVGFKAMDRIRLVNSGKFFSVLKNFNNVIHLISGHIHRTISGHINGFGFSIFKSTCHQMPMQCDSDNVKLSAVEPAAYGILFLSPDGVVVHSEDFDLTKSNKTIFENYK